MHTSMAARIEEDRKGGEERREEAVEGRDGF